MSARRFSFASKAPVAISGLAVSALTAVGLTLAPATAGATDVPLSTAYAIAASGVVNVDKTPDLDSEKGFQEKSTVGVEAPAGLLSVGVLNASVDTSSASASVADLKVGLSEIVDSDVLGISASVIEATCENGEGSAALADAKVAGQNLDVSPPANTEIGLPGLGGVTLNKQVTNDDGSLTVTAISVDLGGLQTIEIASATCAAGEDGPSEEPSTDKPGEAPRPTPVAGHHPVTG